MTFSTASQSCHIRKLHKLDLEANQGLCRAVTGRGQAGRGQGPGEVEESGGDEGIERRGAWEGGRGGVG